MSDVQKEKYKILGLVDIFDDQNNITGQYPIGSVQELPVEFGNKEVAEGRADAFIEDDEDEVEGTDTSGDPDDLDGEELGEAGAMGDEDDGDELE